MTYRERLFEEYPDCTEADIACLCPWVQGYDKNKHCPRYENGLVMKCNDCWDREIDETAQPQELPCVDTWVLEKEPQHWSLVDGTSGVCPNCHKQDYIDPLAKYCRYCGTRLEIEE